MKDPQYLDLRRRLYRFQLEDILRKKGEGIVSTMWGVKRPHLDEFINFAFSYFRIVAVWSAGQPSYVEKICEIIFRDHRPPHLIYTSDDCVTALDGYFEKPLQRMFSSTPSIASMMDHSNTFMVDDRPWTFRQNPHNGILIPRYTPHSDESSSSDIDPYWLLSDNQALPELIDWFSQPEVMSARDVRYLDKSNIFSGY
jgi:TFIIF-interacting CTD phosphatase-like protein